MLSFIINRFITIEALGGWLLITAAVLAMIAANSPLQEYYIM